MDSADHHDHLWTQARLELHLARLLEPNEEDRVHAHARQCDTCRDAIETLRARTPDDAVPEHVPASVLARWPGVAADLPGLERELVEQHLRDCEYCREDLQIAATAATAAPSPIAIARWDRIWAITATAIAASFAVLWWRAPLGHGVLQTEPAHAPGALLPMSAMPLTLAPAPVRLSDVTRGASAAAAVLVEPGPREPVVLAFDPFDVPDDTPIALDLATLSGDHPARLACNQAELYPHRQLVVGDATQPLGDGDYVLRMIAWPGTAQADTQSFVLTVRRHH